MHYDESMERYVLDVPKECVVCGSDLELDVNYDSTFLRCNNCDYELDVTEEFQNVSKANGEDD